MRVDRVRDSLRLLSTAGLSWDEFADEALELVARAVPFEAATMAPIDPESGLVTGSVKRELPSDSYPKFAYYEWTEPDDHTFAALATRPIPIGVLVDDLDGDPARAARYRDFYEPTLSLGHEMRVVARARGRTWGGMSIFRETGSSGFSPAETDFVASLVDTLARGLRIGVAGATTDASSSASIDLAPAVLIVDATNTVVAASGDRDAWFAALDPTGLRPLPIPIVSAILGARATGDTEAAVRAAGAGWVTVRGAVLKGAASPDASSVAVTLDQAGAGESLPRVVAALDLTDRERQVVDLVLVGRSTAEIAASLFLSPYTVQDHLKSIFDKANVRSRRALAAMLLS